MAPGLQGWDKPDLQEDENMGDPSSSSHELEDSALAMTHFPARCHPLLTIGRNVIFTTDSFLRARSIFTHGTFP